MKGEITGGKGTALIHTLAGMHGAAWPSTMADQPQYQALATRRRGVALVA